MLRISLLGVLRLELDDTEMVAPSSRGARLLLAMLALERRAHSREALAARLWPEVLATSARASLRTALAQLRSALGPQAQRFVEAGRERVELAGPEAVWTDVGELERLLGEGEVEAALELWDGELLVGLEEDWVYERRDELRERLCEAVGRRAAVVEDRGDLHGALRLTRRQIALDVLAEEPQRELIRRMAASGDRSGALAAYQRFSDRLRAELRALPSKSTRELAEALRSGAAPAASGGEVLARPEGVLPRPLRFPANRPFVGRKTELARLRELWEGAHGGALAAVFVAGEAGIGKTRLAAEFVDGLQQDEALVLYGRCDEGLAVPYQPFVEALRPYASALGSDGLQVQLGALAPQLGRLLPELQMPRETGRGDPESERFALFEAVSVLIEMATRKTPVLLVLDDLHWAAGPTLLLVRHLIRSERPLRALVLGTYRETELDPGDRLGQLLADLQRDSSAQTLSLRGLDEAAITALLEASANHRLDDRAAEFVQVLRDQTAGNPFFIRELLAHLVESGAIYRTGQRWTSDLRPAQLEIPEGLRAVIRHRVARLSKCARHALTVAAVAGPTFSVALLEHVLGQDSVVLDALDEAMTAGLLAEAGPAAYAFAHALVRQALYAELSSARRMRLHRQVGEALEAIADRDANVEALAYHFAQAAAHGHSVEALPVVGVAKAGVYARLAGERAARQLAYEEAARYFQQALDVQGGRPEERRERCELLLALGSAQRRSGAVCTARATFEVAAVLARELVAPRLLAGAALGYAGALGGPAMPTPTDPVVVAMLEEALGALGAQPSPERAQLLARLALELYYTPDVERRRRLSQQAVETAVAAGDAGSRLIALYSRNWSTLGPDHPEERRRDADELLELARASDDLEMRFSACHFRLANALERGDLAGVDAELAACERLAATLRQPLYSWQAGLLRAMRALLHGRADEGEQIALSAFETGRIVDEEAATILLAVQIYNHRWIVGRLDELAARIDEFASRRPWAPAWQCAAAFILTETGRPHAARTKLDAVGAQRFRDLPRDGNWGAAVALAALTASAIDARDHASALYELAAPLADRVLIVAAGDSTIGPMALYAGALATTLERWDDALTHFDEADRLIARLDARWIAAITHRERARALLARRRPGDHAAATEQCHAALGLARALGMTRLAEQAHELLTQLPATAEGDGASGERVRPDSLSYCDLHRFDGLRAR
jgi:DNA-binding SARP family transcriptional activator/tetratricopeptide (TPR) repeat protein